MTDFATRFQQLAGYAPLSWQHRLAIAINNTRAQREGDPCHV